MLTDTNKLAVVAVKLDKDTNVREISAILLEGRTGRYFPTAQFRTQISETIPLPQALTHFRHWLSDNNITTVLCHNAAFIGPLLNEYARETIGQSLFASPLSKEAKAPVCLDSRLVLLALQGQEPALAKQHASVSPSQKALTEAANWLNILKTSGVGSFIGRATDWARRLMDQVLPQQAHSAAHSAAKTLAPG